MRVMQQIVVDVSSIPGRPRRIPGRVGQLFLLPSASHSEGRLPSEASQPKD